MTDFQSSRTRENLMRAFAGESQARNRYTFAAQEAKKQKLPVVEAIFTFTANQEKEHAEIFFKHLKESKEANLTVEANYPLDLKDDAISLLRAAQHNEYQEHDDAYRLFGDQAKEEGFSRIAAQFYGIAEIEKIHGNRFGRVAELLEQGKLFVSDVETGWLCLNCGYVYRGKEAPKQCPICDHEQGYFIRWEFSPYHMQ